MSDEGAGEPIPLGLKVLLVAAALYLALRVVLMGSWVLERLGVS